MDDRLHTDYATLEAQIARARLQRSVEMARLLGDGADALGRSVSRVVGSILGSLANARDAATIEADVFLKRSRVR